MAISRHMFMGLLELGNVRGGGASVFFKESSPVRCLPNHCLKECLNFEVSINSESCDVVSMYRSASQTSNDFNLFTTNLEKLVVSISSSNPHFTLIIEDFIAKSSILSYNDTKNADGAQLHYLALLYCMKQVITERTHTGKFSQLHRS